MERASQIASPGRFAATPRGERSHAPPEPAGGSPRGALGCSHRFRKTSSAPRSTAGLRSRAWSASSEGSACGPRSRAETDARSTVGAEYRRGSFRQAG